MSTAGYHAASESPPVINDKETKFMYKEPSVQTNTIQKAGGYPPVAPVCPSPTGYCDFQYITPEITCLSQYCAKGTVYGGATNPQLCSDTIHYCGGMQGGYRGPSYAPGNGGTPTVDEQVFETNAAIREEDIGENGTMLTEQNGTEVHVLNETAAEVYHAAASGAMRQTVIADYVSTHSNHDQLREDAAKMLNELKLLGVLTEKTAE